LTCYCYLCRIIRYSLPTFLPYTTQSTEGNVDELAMELLLLLVILPAVQVNITFIFSDVQLLIFLPPLVQFSSVLFRFLLFFILSDVQFIFFLRPFVQFSTVLFRFLLFFIISDLQLIFFLPTVVQFSISVLFRFLLFFILSVDILPTAACSGPCYRAVHVSIIFLTF
jgi:hypothetical protein